MGWPGPLTHRQAIEWKEYTFWTRNEPTPEQYYLMQIAAEIQDCIPAAFQEAYRKIDLLKKRIKFTRKVIRQLTEEEEKEEAKRVSMQYAGMFGFSPEIIANLKPGESIQLGKGSLARKMAELRGEAPPKEKVDRQLIRVKKGTPPKPNPRPKPRRDTDDTQRP